MRAARTPLAVSRSSAGRVMEVLEVQRKPSKETSTRYGLSRCAAALMPPEPSAAIAVVTARRQRAQILFTLQKRPVRSVRRPGEQAAGPTLHLRYNERHYKNTITHTGDTMNNAPRAVTGAALLAVLLALPGFAQDSDPNLAKFNALTESDTMVMVPMRDGVRLATDVYLPKGDGPFPVVFVKTPYNFNKIGGSTPARGRRGDRARVRAGRAERARPLLLGGRLGDPRPAPHRRVRFAVLARGAALVQRQGRYLGLLLDGRVAACAGRTERHPAHAAMPCRWRPAPASGVSASSTNRATGTRAASTRRCSPCGSTACSRILGPSFRGPEPGAAAAAAQELRPGGEHARDRLGEAHAGNCPRSTG